MRAPAKFLVLAAWLPTALHAFNSGQSAALAVGANTLLGLPGPNQNLITPTASTLNGAAGVAVAGSKLIVADTLNHRVLIYNTLPLGNGAAADFVLGQANFSGKQDNRGGPVSASSMSYPRAIATDGTRLYVLDSGNHRVLGYLSIPGSSDTPADFVLGQAGMSSVSQGSGMGEMNFPWDLSSDGGRLAVADMGNHRVLVWNSLPLLTATPADLVVGQSGPGQNSANQGSTSSPQSLSSPSAVALAGGRLYVADSGNHRVMAFHSLPLTHNASADLVVGQSSPFGLGPSNQNNSPLPQTLAGPAGLAASAGRLFIADANNSRVVIHESLPIADNRRGDSFLGQPSGWGSSSTSGPGSLLRPARMAFGGGRLWVADEWGHRVLAFDDVAPQAVATPQPVGPVTSGLSFSDNFDSGPRAEWSFSGMGAGAPLTTAAQALNGPLSLAFQTNGVSTSTRAELCLFLDGSNFVTEIQYSYRRYGSSFNSYPGVINSAYPSPGMGMLISADGLNWVSVDGMGASGPSTITFQPHAVLANKGFTNVSRLRIRFDFLAEGMLPGHGLVVDDFKVTTYCSLVPGACSQPNDPSSILAPATQSDETLIYPNPASKRQVNEVKVSFQSPASGKAVLTLYNMDGMMVSKSYELSALRGQNVIPAPIYTLGRGIYFYVLELRTPDGNLKVFPAGKLAVD